MNFNFKVFLFCSAAFTQRLIPTSTSDDTNSDNCRYLYFEGFFRILLKMARNQFIQRYSQQQRNDSEEDDEDEPSSTYS